VADFAHAIAVTLRMEGGYVDSPHDRGGATNHGISQRYAEKKLGRHVSDDEMRELSVDQAIEWYREDFWLPIYDRIRSQVVATKIFDIGVNCGPGSACRILQRALNCLLFFPMPTVDGIFGEITLAAVDDTDPQQLIETLIYEQIEHYKRIVESDPAQQPNMAAWRIRAQWPLRG